MRKNTGSIIFSVLLALAAVIGFGQVAGAALSAVSPNVDIVNGYPAWYQDSNGLKLTLCLDPLLCLADPVDPANPESVAMGVGGETFYWSAESLIDMPAMVIPDPPGPARIGGQALVVLALEAAMAAEEPIDGDQVVFGRIRIRIDAPVAGVYTVTHPFGVKQFNVETPGRRAINATEDIGGFVLPSNFALALNSNVGPFLVWDPAVLPAAPAGFVGDPNIPHPVIGSPIGQNIFRVDGPVGSNLGGPGVNFVETNLFAVQGAILQPQPPVATVTRDALGAGTVDVMVSDVVVGVPTVNAVGLTLGPVALNPVAGQPGVFSLSIPIHAASLLPATVDVNVDQGAGAAIQTVPLTDIVTVVTATIDPDDPVDPNIVTITAISSNLFDNPAPVLTVTNPMAGPLGTIDTATTDTLAVNNPTPQLGRVVVESDNGGMAVVFVQSLALGDLAAVSPGVDQFNGFPDWYQDHNGLQLGLCLDPFLCISDPVDPANPNSVALGIGGEAFYWAADAGIDFPNGDRAILVLALEAAFANEDPVPGDQVVFGRVRIRIDAPVAGDYTITHPYGVKVINVAAPGVRAINDTVDLGAFDLPADFTAALKGGIGPFLTWDPAVPPLAPEGFVGNPGVLHPVVGSPIGENVFRIEGPAGSNLGGPGVNVVETDLFALQGRRASFQAPPASESTYTRNSSGAGSAIVIAVGPADAVTADVAGVNLPLPNEPISLVPVAGQPGVFIVTVPIGSAVVLPGSVIITLDRGLPTETTQTVNLTDLVSVVRATFDPANNTLTVTAASSDLFGRPVLTVDEVPPAPPVGLPLVDGILGFRNFGTIDTNLTDTLVVSDVIPAPAGVQVSSTAGGAAAAPVTTLAVNPDAPGQPGLGPDGAPLGGGGGGGGGCFIGELFN